MTGRRAITLTLMCSFIFILIFYIVYNHQSGFEGFLRLEWKGRTPIGHQRHTATTKQSAHETSPNQIDNPAKINPSCSKRPRIVYIKTHKTGSTTLGAIFERYGYYHNYSFVLSESDVLSDRHRFTRRDILAFPGMKGRHYDMLAHHAIYNRGEMEALLPNAKYITILREPEYQLESAFTFYRMHLKMGFNEEQNPLEAFMDDPGHHYDQEQNERWFESRNGMLFDLGLDHSYDEDEVAIMMKISEVERDFDLVLILEYFDESLILLKALLCWEFEDIIYMAKNLREKGHRSKLSEKLRGKIRRWSQGDVLLYNRMNQTFWAKVASYGPRFQEDLRYFRELNRNAYAECVNSDKVLYFDKGRELHPLKSNSSRCLRIFSGTSYYTSLIRQYMVKQFGGNTK